MCIRDSPTSSYQYSTVINPGQSIIFDKGDLNHGTNVTLNDDELKDGKIKAVSYTHLDVYKRQSALPSGLSPVAPRTLRCAALFCGFPAQYSRSSATTLPKISTESTICLFYTSRCV